MRNHLGHSNQLKTLSVGNQIFTRVLNDIINDSNGNDHAQFDMVVMQQNMKNIIYMAIMQFPS